MSYRVIVTREIGSVSFADDDETDAAAASTYLLPLTPKQPILEQNSDGSETPETPLLENSSYLRTPYLALFVLGIRLVFLTRKTYDDMPTFLRRVADKLMVPQKAD
jgi:hypothetical protein